VNLVKSSDPNWDIINPSLVRMGVTIRKCATLLAVSDGRMETELIDVLGAISAAEEWVANLMVVARQINASDFERNCDEVEAFVQSKDDRVKLEFVNRRFKAWRVRDLQEAIGALASQGRIKEVSESGAKWLAINK
jgi:pyoverdine/dityrosine biosynthesis protein Dit1